MIKKLMISVFMVLVLLSLTVGIFGSCAPAPEKAAPKVLHLNFSNTAASSGYFPPRVAMVKIINREVPEVRATCIEGATEANAQRMRDGVFHMGSGEGPYLYWGEGPWKGDPWPYVRQFFGVTKAGGGFWYMRKDSRAKTFKDLNGLDICPGYRGGSAEIDSEAICKVLADVAKPKLFRATLEDADRALTANKIQGMFKYTASPTNIDPALNSIHVTIPLVMVGLTKAEAERCMASGEPTFISKAFELAEVGRFVEWPDQGNCYVLVANLPAAQVNIRNDIPEDLVYKMVKALCANFKEIQVTVPGSEAVKNPIKTMLDLAKMASPRGIIPWHAGVVRYARDIGLDIPAHLIPPELGGTNVPKGFEWMIKK